MIIYLHGFNSGGGSAKASALRRMFAPVPVLSPTYPVHRAAEAIRFLRDYIRQARGKYPQDLRLVLAGSSLGALYTRYLAGEFNAAIVLINPAMRPEQDLLARVGQNLNEATGERYLLTKAQVRALGTYQIVRCDPAVPTLVLLDEGDELLDYRVAAAFFSGCGKTITYPGGSHRFEHLPEAEPDIRRLHDTGAV
ncbi:MAG: YqiA/YcfP family alpha/beta fold hydrolase [Acidiferrobacterales bacterium]